MPIYEYECQECQSITELWQSMSDGPLEKCPDCDGPVQKLISQSSFHLKGGGWYADGYGNSKSSGASKDSTPAKSKAKAEKKASCPKAANCPCAS
ncbi:MAG: FmdB family zinc ribbon protein [Thermodesulfobacteriota bacterium]